MSAKRLQEIVDKLEPRESRHLLGVLRAEIQRYAHVAYVFAGSEQGLLLPFLSNAV